MGSVSLVGAVDIVEVVEELRASGAIDGTTSHSGPGTAGVVDVALGGTVVVVLGAAVVVAQGSEVVGALSAEAASGEVDSGGDDGDGVVEGCAYAVVDPDASKSAMVPMVSKDRTV